MIDPGTVAEALDSNPAQTEAVWPALDFVERGPKPESPLAGVGG